MFRAERALLGAGVVLAAGVAFSVSPASAEGPADPYEGRERMNGHRLADFVGFPERWRLVTVRFRRDNGEQRFTYANELAWKALEQGSTDYPDGAIFGKVGRMTVTDPAFPSSAVPAGAKRYQFMVRDHRRFAETGGWGYMIFDANGRTFPGEPRAAAMACAACHHAVAARGEVFSQIADLGVGNLAPAVAPTPPALSLRRVASAALPAPVRAALPPGTRELMQVEGPMVRHVFSGTLEEIIPTLALAAARHGIPAGLVSADGKAFSIVFSGPPDPRCTAQGEVSFVVARSLERSRSGVGRRSFCQRRDGLEPAQ